MVLSLNFDNFIYMLNSTGTSELQLAGVTSEINSKPNWSCIFLSFKSLK